LVEKGFQVFSLHYTNLIQHEVGPPRWQE